MNAISVKVLVKSAWMIREFLKNRAMQKVFSAFIIWCVRRSHYKIRVVGYDNKTTSFYRYCPFWKDEFTGETGIKYHRPPWYRPFNILLHRWVVDDKKSFHDHPRWSITLCLRGQITEVTPWGRRVLRPGSLVFRSHKYIHLFELDDQYKGKTWTLFIVGRRNHKQNDYIVKGYHKEF